MKVKHIESCFCKTVTSAQLILDPDHSTHPVSTSHVPDEGCGESVLLCDFGYDTETGLTYWIAGNTVFIQLFDLEKDPKCNNLQILLPSKPFPKILIGRSNACIQILILTEDLRLHSALLDVQDDFDLFRQDLTQNLQFQSIFLGQQLQSLQRIVGMALCGEMICVAGESGVIWFAYIFEVQDQNFVYGFEFGTGSGFLSSLKNLLSPKSKQNQQKIVQIFPFTKNPQESLLVVVYLGEIRILDVLEQTFVCDDLIVESQSNNQINSAVIVRSGSLHAPNNFYLIVQFNKQFEHQQTLQIIVLQKSVMMEQQQRKSIEIVSQFDVDLGEFEEKFGALVSAVCDHQNQLFLLSKKEGRNRIFVLPISSDLQHQGEIQVSLLQEDIFYEQIGNHQEENQEIQLSIFIQFLNRITNNNESILNEIISNYFWGIITTPGIFSRPALQHSLLNIINEPQIQNTNQFNELSLNQIYQKLCKFIKQNNGDQQIEQIAKNWLFFTRVYSENWRRIHQTVCLVNFGHSIAVARCVGALGILRRISLVEQLCHGQLDLDELVSADVWIAINVPGRLLREFLIFLIRKNPQNLNFNNNNINKTSNIYNNQNNTPNTNQSIFPELPNDDDDDDDDGGDEIFSMQFGYSKILDIYSDLVMHGYNLNQNAPKRLVDAMHAYKNYSHAQLVNLYQSAEAIFEGNYLVQPLIEHVPELSDEIYGQEFVMQDDEQKLWSLQEISFLRGACRAFSTAALKTVVATTLSNLIIQKNAVSISDFDPIFEFKEIAQKLSVMLELCNQRIQKNYVNNQNNNSIHDDNNINNDDDDDGLFQIRKQSCISISDLFVTDNFGCLPLFLPNLFQNSSNFASIKFCQLLYTDFKPTSNNYILFFCKTLYYNFQLDEITNFLNRFHDESTNAGYLFFQGLFLAHSSSQNKQKQLQAVQFFSQAIEQLKFLGDNDRNIWINLLQRAKDSHIISDVTIRDCHITDDTSRALRPAKNEIFGIPNLVITPDLWSAGMFQQLSKVFQELNCDVSAGCALLEGMRKVNLRNWLEAPTEVKKVVGHLASGAFHFGLKIGDVQMACGAIQQNPVDESALEDARRLVVQLASKGDIQSLCKLPLQGKRKTIVDGHVVYTTMFEAACKGLKVWAQQYNLDVTPHPVFTVYKYFVKKNLRQAAAQMLFTYAKNLQRQRCDSKAIHSAVYALRLCREALSQCRDQFRQVEDIVEVATSQLPTAVEGNNDEDQMQFCMEQQIEYQPKIVTERQVYAEYVAAQARLTLFKHGTPPDEICQKTSFQEVVNALIQGGVHKNALNLACLSLQGSQLMSSLKLAFSRMATEAAQQLLQVSQNLQNTTNTQTPLAINPNDNCVPSALNFKNVGCTNKMEFLKSSFEEITQDSFWEEIGTQKPIDILDLSICVAESFLQCSCLFVLPEWLIQSCNEDALLRLYFAHGRMGDMCKMLIFQMEQWMLKRTDERIIMGSINLNHQMVNKLLASEKLDEVNKKQLDGVYEKFKQVLSNDLPFVYLAADQTI